MINDNKKKGQEEASPCGLFCHLCPVFIVSREDENGLSEVVTEENKPFKKIFCYGCKADKISTHCANCLIRSCAKERQVILCSECKDYPCELLQDFQKKMPRKNKFRASLKEINEQAYEKWYEEMLEMYSLKKRGLVPDKEILKMHIEKVKKYFKIEENE